MELLKLKKRRSAQKSVITRQITKLGETDDMDHFQTIIKSLQTKYAALEQLNENIFSFTDEDDYKPEMVDAEDFLLDLKLKLQDFQKKMSANADIPPPLLHPEEPPLEQQPSRDHSNSASDDSSATTRYRTYVSNSSVNSSQSSQFHKLQKLSLPFFTGNILEWQTLWDSFESSVHRNGSLSDIQRFSYLRSLLQGDAARVIEGFPLTHTNYIQAVELLKERFGQEHQIVYAYMQGLLELPRPTSTIVSLRTFQEKMESYIRGLQSLGQGQESFGNLLVSVILGKLPADVKHNMTRDYGNNKWQLQDLRQALKKEIDILESGLPTLTSEMHQATAPLFTSTGSNWQRTRICDQQKVVPASGTNMGSKASNFVPAHAPGGSSPSSSDATLQVFHSTTQPRSGVLLKTAVAKATSGIYIVDAIILFDEGAQRLFVTRDLANKLQLQTSDTEEVQLAAFGSSSKKVSHIHTATVYLLTDSREKIAIDVLIVPTNAVPLGNRQRGAVSLPYLRGIKLAHPLTGEDIFSISLLIGADKYWDIVGYRVIRGDGPTAVQSKIGYLLFGPLPTPTTETATDCIMNTITSPPDMYDLERFWKLETLGIQSEKDDESSSEYLATYQRNCIVFKDGRCSAQLPWKPYRVPDPPALPKIRVQCTRFQRNYRGAAYRKRRSHTSSDVTDEQRSHQIKAHSEALPIRSSTNVFFVAGRMLRR